MKALLTSGLGLALGLWAAHAGAQDIEWRSSPRTPAHVSSASPVRLGVPRSAEGASLIPESGLAPTIVRAKAQPEEAKPLPSGPTLKLGEPKTLDPKAKGEFIPSMPAPISGPAVGTHHVGMPAGMPASDPCCGDSCGIGGDCCGPVRGLFRGGWNQCCGILGIGDGIGLGAGDGCCPQRPCFWINGSYLLWSIRGQDTPPLVVTNPTAAPILGAPGSTVALGGDEMENEWRSGGRAQVGFWFPECDQWGLDVGGFFLGRRNSIFELSSTGSPQIGRPFTNADNNLPFSELVAGGGVAGGIRAAHAFSLWGVDAHVRRKAGCGPRGWCDVFVGYRHLNLNESLDITETPASTAVAFVVNDRFATRNQFNGVDFGFQFERRIGESRWFVQGGAKVALGNMYQIVNISGSTTRTIGGVSQTAPGGFAALPSNIGKFERNKFGVIPEANLKIGYDLTERVRIFAGYDFLWMNSVVRPGEQIDTSINLGQVPFRNLPNTGQARPAVLFRDSSFWAQGASFGLEWRY